MNAHTLVAVGVPNLKATVLVVEDDPQLRAIYRNALAAAGYAVISAGDGVDALRHIDQSVPHAIVLDLGLPRLHGEDVERELRSSPATKHVPLVVVTGHDLTPARAADFDCVLRKPVDVDALVDAVARCLKKRRG